MQPPVDSNKTECQNPMRFLLVQDHPFYAEGFCSALRRMAPDSRITHLSNGQDAKTLGNASQFTLAFIDARLPDMEGIALMQHFRDAASSTTAALSAREFDVLRCLGEGLENRDISLRLNVSDATLKSHLKSIFQKLSVGNRTACVVKAIKTGML